VFSLVPVLLAAATIVWIFVFLLPGDPARLIAGGQSVDPDVLGSIRHEWGLDRPAPLQYLHYLVKLARFDLGTSYVQRRPVASIIAGSFPPTLVLAVAAMVIARYL